MPNRSQIHILSTTLLLITTTAGDATPVLSAALDTKDFDAACFNLHIGGVLGTGSGAMTYKVVESDDNVTYTDAPATSVVDDGSALAVNTTKRIAYVGTKRYAKLEVTPKAADVYSITGTRGYPYNAPVTNPL